jgi:hypothetical protein
MPNVELIRAKDGAPAAPQRACLTKAPDPLIGSAFPLPAVAQSFSLFSHTISFLLGNR